MTADAWEWLVSTEEKCQLEYIWDLQSYRGQVSCATGWRMIEAREDTPNPPNPICHLTIPPSPPKGSLPLKRKHKKGSLPFPFFGLKFTSSQNTRQWILHTLEILIVDHQLSYICLHIFKGNSIFMDLFGEKWISNFSCQRKFDWNGKCLTCSEVDFDINSSKWVGGNELKQMEQVNCGKQVNWE